jgi:D-glycero-alpha-D-manno-heptose 1-phosphate guanylyltransferase
MELKEAIILAGGLGTRLRGVVPNLPKCMALVAGKPFLYYLIRELQSNGIKKFIFSLSYKSEVIIDYLEKNFKHIDFEYTVEEKLLGTGGAIKLAMSKTKYETVLVVNGDTLFRFNLNSLDKFAIEKNAICTLLVTKLEKSDRFGFVVIKEDIIESFLEKGESKEGYINAGVYAINKSYFIENTNLEIFSFENEFLKKEVLKKRIHAQIQEGYFIDMGVPEDYFRANEEFNLVK